MHRLETLSREFAERLEHLAPDEQRAVAAAACEFALGRTRVSDPAVDSGLHALRSGQAVALEDRNRIRSLLDRLDDKYFELQEAAEDGREAADCYEDVFAQARAMAALYYALDGDPLTAASEAVYEAAIAVGNAGELFAAIDFAFQH
jgi:hypothetical protein